MKILFRARIFFIVLLLPFTQVVGQIKLPELISDGAVLQRNTEVNIWGWASPGEKVSLEFMGQLYTVTTGANGEWQMSLPPQKAGGPYEMHFIGKNKISLKNILFGDVWLCSGQSNMELTMQRVKDKYPEYIKNAHNPNIRQFLVPDIYEFQKEHKDFKNVKWVEVDPKEIYNFSAIAYFFALEINNKYNVPVGLINAALGGSPIEAWMSEDALKIFPDSYAELQKFKDAEYVNSIRKNDEMNSRNWYTEVFAKDKGSIKGEEWFLPSIDDTDWQQIEVPGLWSKEDLKYKDGIVWYRKMIDVPKTMLGKDATLWLGRIVDSDSVYVNGSFVGSTGYQYPPRKYTVAKNVLREGKNTIAIKITNERGAGGTITDKPYFLAVENDTLDLTGTWNYKLAAEMPPKKSQTFIRWKPAGLYNAMIAPLRNYKIKGVIWYQGESNTRNPEKYSKTFPALIRDWRKQLQQGDFPFIYAQLPNFMKETPEPTESNWAAMRQAQLNALSLPNTGMAVTIDLGEWNDIHPLNKKDVSKRLAQQAIKLAYDKNDRMALSSPIPKKAKFLTSKVVINFANVKQGLMAKNDKTLHYFEISNDGKTFVKAHASIKGNKVRVSHPEIKNPIVVRYAWADNPVTANLYSKEGLPASPFQVKK